MQTKVLKASKESIHKAAGIIQAGGLVAFPTETVYGLGADALNPRAVKKIFLVKKRPFWDPILVHIADKKDLEMLTKNVPNVAYKLIEKFWPGPLSLRLYKSAKIPKVVTAGLDTVVIRMPSNKIALDLIKASKTPIAAPSANLFSRPSPTSANHVLEDLNGRIELILDGGDSAVGVESTVLDLTTKTPTILRQGGVTQEQLEKLLGKVLLTKNASKKASPGAFKKHYSPKTKLVTCEGTPKDLQKKINKNKKKKIGIMLPKNWQTLYPKSAEVFNWGDFNNTKQLAKNLYKGLRYLDTKKLDIIIAPKPPAGGFGSTILDKLKRAVS